MTLKEKLKAQCPKCRLEIPLPATSTCSQQQCEASINQGVLAFGAGYSEDITSVHRSNIDTEEKRLARANWDRHYVAWCLETAEPYISTGESCWRVLSLGCGLAFDVLEFVARGHDAYGIETANLSGIWPDVGHELPARCVVSTSGKIPFADEAFDLIVSMNVLGPVDIQIDKGDSLVRRNLIQG